MTLASFSITMVAITRSSKSDGQGSRLLLLLLLPSLAWVFRAGAGPIARALYTRLRKTLVSTPCSSGRLRGLLFLSLEKPGGGLGRVERGDGVGAIVR